MKFVDEVRIQVEAGNGGDGCASFRREKYIPRGGPSGGDGGNGGSVVLRVDSGLATLIDLSYPQQLRGGRGENGRGKDQYGKGGDDLVLRVPPGTVVYDEEAGTQVADLRAPGAEAIVAQGGHGGRGNIHFATSTQQAPHYAEPGEPGEHKRLRLELRVLADVGLLGFPNVGKSTLIRSVTAARPRVADYPFTTLVPHLGVVRIDEAMSFVIADVPGLLPGAHTGHGLGIRFLRHLSRTAVLIHLLDPSGSITGRDPLDDFDVINRELALASPELAAKPQLVVAGKLDLTEAREQLPALRERFAARGITLHALSGVSGEGTRELMQAVARAVLIARATAAAAPADEVPPAESDA